MTPLDPPTAPPAPGDSTPGLTDIGHSAQPTPSPSPARGSTATWIVGIALAAVLGTILFAGGYLAAGGNRHATTCAATSSAFAAVCYADQQLKADYVDKANDTKLAEGTLQGMIHEGVQDIFSCYMSAQD